MAFMGMIYLKREFFSPLTLSHFFSTDNGVEGGLKVGSKTTSQGS